MNKEALPDTREQQEVNSGILKKKVVIIGGGPAGALAGYLLAGSGVSVDIYEPRSIRQPDFSLGETIVPCTGCAGLLQENTLALLTKKGLPVPNAVIQTRLKQNVVHLPGENETISIPTRGVTVYRGFGPVGQRIDGEVASFDAWLLQQAIYAGATHHTQRVESIDVGENGAVLTAEGGEKTQGDLVIGAFGHNPILFRNITYARRLRSRLDEPITGAACVREYSVSKGIGRLNEKHVFGNPTNNIWFAGILPKGANSVSIALMGRENVTQGDFSKFLSLPTVRELLGTDIVGKRPSCACTRGITLKSPRQFMITNASGALVMVDIGDAGPSRPRVNGIYAAMDSAAALTAVLVKFGNTPKASVEYKRYIEREYIWDNHFAEGILKVFDFVLNNALPRKIALALAQSKLSMVSGCTKEIMDYVLSGKGPYWQILINFRRRQ